MCNQSCLVVTMHYLREHSTFVFVQLVRFSLLVPCGFPLQVLDLNKKSPLFDSKIPISRFFFTWNVALLPFFIMHHLIASALQDSSSIFILCCFPLFLKKRLRRRNTHTQYFCNSHLPMKHAFTLNQLNCTTVSVGC